MGTTAEQVLRHFIGKTAIAIIFSLVLFHTDLVAEGWPTYMHDAERSGESSELVTFPLHVQWVYKMRHEPSPAWPPPAPYDFWHTGDQPLDPLVTFDRACHVISSDNKVLFGSSSDDKVYCLDAVTGKEIWTFFTEAPVRFAPTVVNNAVHFGSDDGTVYSVNIDNGNLNWKYSYKSDARKIPGNERIISCYPVRTDILHYNSELHFGAGLFPKSLGARNIKLNAADGQQVTNKSISFSPQGYLYRSGSSIMCPTGRTDDKTFSDVARRNRQHKEYEGAVIEVGGTRISGSNGKVSGGSWSSNVEGKAYSCAFSNGRLFVSTDEGYLYCFSSNSTVPDTIKPVIKDYPYSTSALKQQYVDAAENIVSSANTTKGYCLVLDNEGGHLAYELAVKTDLNIICVESDSAKVAQVRRNLDSAGVYGQVSVHHITSTTLPYTNFLFNIVVYDGYATGGTFTGSKDEAKRVLRPYGGTAFFSTGSGGVFKKGELIGAGEWTHNYNNPQNNPFSQDIHVGDVDKTTLQWFGQPGPERRVDRHNRTPSPLWKNGTLFVPGQNWMTAVDAYNGTILWDKEIPLSSRLPGFRDAGHFVVAEDYLYISSDDECLGFTHREGEQKLTFPLPSFGGSGSYTWGYVALVDDILFGSAENDEDIAREASLETDYQSYFDNRPWGMSDCIFAIDRHTGTGKWLYEPSSGGIVNTTIVIADGRIIFVESGNSSTLTAEKSRFKLDEIFGNKQTNVVALNMSTGTEVWRKQFDFSNFQNTVYMIYSHDKAVVSGTYNENSQVTYDFYAFNGANGTPLWSTSVQSGAGTNGDHGDQDGHPVVVGDKMYMSAFHEGVCVNITTGQSINWNFDRGGHGCSQISATKNNLFYRGDNPISYNIADDNLERFTTTTRSGCWINMIPAGGLLNIPEYSSGCTCDYSMQTSLAYLSNMDMQTAIYSTKEKPVKKVPKHTLLLSRGAHRISITISNVLPSDKLHCQIINAAGRTLFQERAVAGKNKHTFTWDNYTLSTGVYFISLKTPTSKLVRKMLVVK